MPPAWSLSPAWSLLPAGERAVMVELDPADGGRSPARVAAEVRAAAARSGVELEDVVPGAVTVLCVVPTPAGLGPLRALLEQIHVSRTERGSLGEGPGPESGVVVVEVTYDGEDLAAVAAEIGASPEEVVARHTAGRYEAAFTGFAPGFAYLTGLDPLLRVPRLPQARAVVPAGSVAIADRYSAVYPRATPGGWRLLGRTTAVLWDPQRRPPALLTPGVAVRFRAGPRG